MRLKLPPGTSRESQQLTACFGPHIAAGPSATRRHRAGAAVAGRQSASRHREEERRQVPPSLAPSAPDPPLPRAPSLTPASGRLGTIASSCASGPSSANAGVGRVRLGPYHRPCRHCHHYTRPPLPLPPPFAVPRAPAESTGPASSPGSDGYRSPLRPTTSSHPARWMTSHDRTPIRLARADERVRLTGVANAYFAIWTTTPPLMSVKYRFCASTASE